MSVQTLLTQAQTHQPKFKTVAQWQAWQAAEQIKDGKPVHQARLDAKMTRLFNKACVPPLHQKCTFDNYTATNTGQQNALNIASHYALSFNEQLAVGRCMIFRGSTGTGKNHLASAIANHVLLNGYSAMVIKVSDLMSRYRSSYRRDSEFSEEQLSRELIAVDLLILDEIGLAHGSNDEVVQINRLIDNRINNIKPILALSNLPDPDFENCLGSRNYDRLLANKGVFVEFNWQSFRRQGAA